MASILGFRVQNYRSLKDVTFGKLWNDKVWGKIAQLTPLTAVIGKNGVGKSTLFDAFGFLSDCLRLGVRRHAMHMVAEGLSVFVLRGKMDPFPLRYIIKKIEMLGQ